MVILIIATPPTTINAELVQKFQIIPTSDERDPDPYAIHAVYGKDDSDSIYTGELSQCEMMLKKINAKLDPSGHDQIELTPQREIEGSK